MNRNKRGLGRGLEALLGDTSAPTTEETLRELPLDRLRPGRYQPRRSFDADALNALADSIRAQGVVQPVVVREISGVDGGGYEIIAGERRCRAARIAGLKTIPAIVRPMADRQAMAVALVENIQRADLNPLEEAEALRRLIDDCGLTHDDAAASIGRSRTAVTNLLRVIDLEPETRELLRSGALSLGHAKVLLSLGGAAQIALARRVVEVGLSVRATEQALRQVANVPQPGNRPAPAAADGDARRLSAAIGLPVKIEHGLNGTGRLVLRFSNREEFSRLMERLAPDR